MLCFLEGFRSYRDRAELTLRNWRKSVMYDAVGAKEYGSDLGRNADASGRTAPDVDTNIQLAIK